MDLNEDVDIETVKTEIWMLRSAQSLEYTVSLGAVYHVPLENGGSVYLILDPWLKLSPPKLHNAPHRQVAHGWENSPS